MVEGTLRRLYHSLRGSELPPELPAKVLAAVAAERGIELTRGTVHSFRYQGCDGLHFRGPRTKVRTPGMLRIGRGVVLNADVVVECFSRGGILLGDRVTVARGASLLASGVIREPGVGISIGPHSSVGAGNVIWGQGGVTIGADCLLGPNVVVVSENHDISDPSVLLRDAPGQRAEIAIEDDCWLGAGSVVLAGVRIGAGSVVGAGAVVSRSLPPGSVAVGIPARVVRTRVPT